MAVTNTARLGKYCSMYSKESCKEGEGVDSGIALPHFSRVEFCRAPDGMNNVWILPFESFKTA